MWSRRLQFEVPSVQREGGARERSERSPIPTQNIALGYGFVSRILRAHGYDYIGGAIDDCIDNVGAAARRASSRCPGRSPISTRTTWGSGSYSAPGLVDVVRRPRVAEHVCAVVEETSGDGVTDTGPAVTLVPVRLVLEVTGQA